MAILNPAHEITEQELGCQVLRRRPGYDPQEDTIVRVQMRHLRERLDKYFSSEGKDETLRVSIPKGAYVLRFERHAESASAEIPAASGPTAAMPAEPPALDPDPVASAEPVAIRAAIAEIPSRQNRAAGVTGSRAWIWAAAVAIVFATFLLGRWSGKATSAAEPTESALNPVLSRLFTRNHPTSLLIADSSMVLVQDVLHLDLSLDDYITRSYRSAIADVPEAGLRAALMRAADRQYTSLADATLASRFFAIGKSAGSKVELHYARHLNVRDLNSGNFIMVGSRRGVPWVELFEPQMNFRMTMEGGGLGFRNMQPQPGEPAGYWSAPSDGWNRSSSLPLETYATVSLLPNLTSSGTVLILNGATMEASEAAGEFILRPDFPQMMGRLMGADFGEKSSYFEILLKVGSVAGAPNSTSVISWRKPKLPRS